MTSSRQDERTEQYRVPGIILADGPAGPRARIKGTGIEVFEVINSLHKLDDDEAALVDAYHWLTPEQIQAALTYYRQYPDEIEQFLSGDEEEELREIQALIAARYGQTGRK